MLRTNIYSVALLVLLAVGCSAAFCPATNYQGSIYSGTTTIIQHKLSQRLMEVSSPSAMVSILNATITVCRTLSTLPPMWQSLFTASKPKPPIICSFLSSPFDLTVFLFFHLSSERNGHIPNGIRYPSPSSPRTEPI